MFGSGVRTGKCLAGEQKYGTIVSAGLPLALSAAVLALRIRWRVAGVILCVIRVIIIWRFPVCSKISTLQPRQRLEGSPSLFTSTLAMHTTI